jgi:signal transduction histidine kinase/ligand-binding sensor domain-containing protein
MAIVFFTIRASHAQYGFERWTLDNGLPENEIRGITQTPDGYVWIATFNGLLRFDGLQFTTFNKTTPKLSSSQFGSILQGRDGDLWIDSVDNGLVRYHNGVFRPYTSQDGLVGEVVNGLTGDNNGGVWALTDAGIFQWNDASGRFTDIAPGSPRLPYRILMWGSKGFWVRQNDKVRCFTKGHFVDYTLPKQMLSDVIWGAAMDQSGTLWVEVVDGKQARITADNVSHLVKPEARENVTITGRNNSWTMRVGPRLTQTFEFVSSNQALSIAAWSFYEDRQGSIWIGTRDQGLYRLQKQSIHTYSKEQGLIDRDVYAVYQDRSNAVWIGAWHSGLSRFENGKFTNYTMADGLPNELVTALFEDREGRFWVGSHGGLSIFENGHFRRPDGPALPHDAVVQAICQDHDGTLWFGTRTGLARYRNGVTERFTKKDGLASNDIHVIVADSKGDLWLGGNGGLTQIHDGKFVRWTEKNGLPSNNIWSIYEDSEGVLWFGTYDAGLVRLQDGKFTNYSIKDGLFDNSVFRILEDGHGNLWISCERGIYRVSKQELKSFASHDLKAITSVAYGKVDGMVTIQCNGGVWPSGIKSNDGKLWFPTQDGVAVIDPEAVAHDSAPPPVMIESATIDNTPVPLSPNLRIPPGNVDVEINYAALSFINAAQTHYEYKLEGLDDNWTNAGERRVAYYSHLPSGKYVFHVIAANSEGVWNNEGKTIPVTVLAPFYETWWFETLLCLILAGLVAIAWKYRVSQLERARVAQQVFSRQLMASQEAERKRIAAEMHDSLGQRLVLIKNLAYLLRRSKKDVHKDGDELQIIKEIDEEASSAIQETREISYNLRPFQLDRLGLTKAIEAMIRTTASASGIHITSELDNIDDIFSENLRINFYRIVQESLGNIMKHSQATEANVSISLSANNLILRIDDNGRGFTPGEHAAEPSTSGFGLTGMGERASLLGGEFKIRSIQNQGTTVTVEIPVKDMTHVASPA